MSGIFKRFLGPAFLLFGLLALLCSMPASPARAGAAGPGAGDCPPEGQPQCGEPINPATGNLYEKVTDFTTVGQNPLAVTRHYNSNAGIPSGSFGNPRRHHCGDAALNRTERHHTDLSATKGVDTRL